MKLVGETTDARGIEVLERILAIITSRPHSVDVDVQGGVHVQVHVNVNVNVPI